jgi:hypothetical protein
VVFCVGARLCTQASRKQENGSVDDAGRHVAKSRGEADKHDAQPPKPRYENYHPSLVESLRTRIARIESESNRGHSGCVAPVRRKTNAGGNQTGPAMTVVPRAAVSAPAGQENARGDSTVTIDALGLAIPSLASQNDRVVTLGDADPRHAQRRKVLDRGVRYGVRFVHANGVETADLRLE